MAAKLAYTFEVATNAPKGIWKVVDRTFADRRLTISEKRRAMQAGNDAAFLASALSTLKVEGEELTEEWVADHLSEQDVVLAIMFILHGAEGPPSAGAADAG